VYTVIDFFQPVGKGQVFEKGMFYWTCVHRPFLNPKIMRWTNAGTKLIDVRGFTSNTEKDDPASDTKAGEFWGLTSYKKRAVLIVSTRCPPYIDVRIHGNDLLIVAPVYTIRDEATQEYKFSPETVWDAITYNIPSMFYLPRADHGEVRESFVFFEQMHVVHCSWLEPALPIRLSDDGLGCLDIWLRNYLNGSIPSKFAEEIDAYRKLVGDDLHLRTNVVGQDKYLTG
jgi:hypothetical protein